MHVKVATTKGIIHFVVEVKINLHLICPFLILVCVGKVAYRLALPTTLSLVHNVLHISTLRKYVLNPYRMIQFSSFNLNSDFPYEEQPTKVVYFKQQELWK